MGGDEGVEFGLWSFQSIQLCIQTSRWGLGIKMGSSAGK